MITTQLTMQPLSMWPSVSGRETRHILPSEECWLAAPLQKLQQLYLKSGMQALLPGRGIDSLV